MSIADQVRNSADPYSAAIKLFAIRDTSHDSDVVTFHFNDQSTVRFKKLYELVNAATGETTTHPVDEPEDATHVQVSSRVRYIKLVNDEVFAWRDGAWQSMHAMGLRNLVGTVVALGGQWHTHTGGDPIINYDRVIEVEHRCGSWGVTRPGNLSWAHTGGGLDIIRWRYA